MPKKNSLKSVSSKHEEKENLSLKSNNGHNGKNGNIYELSPVKSIPKEKVINALRLMLTSRSMDEKAMRQLKQGKSFFHIAGAGHEAIQVAVGMQLDPEKDWMFPYYRDIAVALCVGMIPKEFFYQCFAKIEDPSTGGKQLPCHWGSPKINLPTQSSPTGTQFLQAVGTALASVKKGIKNITYVSSGEGTTSQGEFHEAVNWASRAKLPVLFVIENNKYAISVHVEEQSGGRENSIAEMMAGYANLFRKRIDGTNFYESYSAVSEAIK